MKAARRSTTGRGPVSAVLCSLASAIVLVSATNAHAFRAPRTEVSEAPPWVVYGEDGRQDVKDIKDKKVRDIARSTYAMIPQDRLYKTDGGYSITSKSYQEEYNLCPTERFIDQRTAADCSGSLIAKDIVMTAGHCIINESFCKGNRFVFDFAVGEDGQTPSFVEADKVYSCKEVITSSSGFGESDFALVRLDRPVTDREPLKIRQSGRPSVGDKLFVIGHPSGLPAKIANGANVRALRDGVLVANLDTYAGNSGSAVFNEETLEIEGILVSGESDFEPSNQCTITKFCKDDDCMGEDVTLVEMVRDFIPNK